MRFRAMIMTGVVSCLVTCGLLVALDAGRTEAVTLTPAQPLVATVDHSEAISRALAYLATEQQADGGIAWFGGQSHPGATARAMLALAAAGRPVESMVSVSGTTMVGFLAAQAITYTHDASGTTSAHLFPFKAGILLAAAAAANVDPTSFGGMDLLAELQQSYHPATGAYSTTAVAGWDSGAANAMNQGWAVYGLVAAGVDVPVAAADFLVSLQEPAGTWYYGDPDLTGLAVMALIGSGHVAPIAPPIQMALAYFRAAQLPSGGWRPWWDTDPANPDTTGWIIQALVAAGYDPVTESWANPLTPHDALVNLQQPDGRIGGLYANAYSTAEALYGLTEAPLYLLGRYPRAVRALAWMSTQQGFDGSWPGFTGAPSSGSTLDALLAYAAAGFQPNSVAAPGGGQSPVFYLQNDAYTYTHDLSGTLFPGLAGKLVVGVVAAGEDPTAFGLYPSGHVSAGLPIDLADALLATYHPATGAYSTTASEGWDSGAAGPVNQTWAMLGLAAAGESIPAAASGFLKALQLADGSWGYVDDTGAALQALAAAGIAPNDPSVISATLNLRDLQDASGGWGNPNSTAYGIQGLLAVGEDLTADWLTGGRSPFDALASYQKVDGPFVYTWQVVPPWLMPADNGLATWQAVPALMGVTYPYQPGTLSPYSPMLRGPDPDRLVAATPRASWANSVEVVVPFGSDLDVDSSVTLDWRVVGAADWVTGTGLIRNEGYLTATLPLTSLLDLEFRVTLTDADQVQYGGSLAGSVVLTATLAPERTFLPLVNR